MRWLPERLPFSYRLLVAFTVPVLIWVLVSVISVFTLNRVDDNYARLMDAERNIILANEYRNIIDDIREAERTYIITSSEHYLVEHRDAMRRGRSLYAELGRHVSAQPEQFRQLEQASETLRSWFYEYSRPRVEARRAVPYQAVRDARLIQLHLLSMLAANAANADPRDGGLPGGNLEELRRALESMQTHAGTGKNSGIVQRALEHLDRYESAANSNSFEAATSELQAAADILIPLLAKIIDAEQNIYSMIIDSVGPALASEFEKSMTAFINVEQTAVEEHRVRAEFAASFIDWIIWSGLSTGVLLIVIVVLWFVRRLGRSVESIDQAAAELAKGNFHARARGDGSASKLAEHFNSMAALIEKRHEQTKQLTMLGEMLHNCKSIDEALKVFGEFAGTLFPGHPGMLYLVETNQMDVTAVASWNDGESYSGTHMTMQDCWGLRLARLHENGANGTIRCRHMIDPEADSLCVPLPAFGQIIGLIFIVLDIRNSSRTERDRQRQFVDTSAEQVALALANVKLREELESQAIRDPLTQLYNRRQLEETMDREMQRAVRHSTPLAILAFDIDHFKKFNDTHGHDGGDAVLRSMGETLRDFFRPEDSVFRSGGEEFITVLPGMELSDAVARAEYLRKEIAGMDVLQGNLRLPSVTVSVGVAIYPQHAEDTERLLKVADLALYEAKSRGRNRVVSASDI